MRTRPFIQVERVDYKGREYADFYPSRNHLGRGFVVLGRCTDVTQYGGTLVHTCATPIKYEGARQFHAGFDRKRDAQAFADYLNAN